MGASIFSLFSCVKTAAYDVSDEKVYNTKGFRKSGVVNEGALIMAFLINSNDSLSSLFHLKTAFFLSLLEGVEQFVKNMGQIILQNLFGPGMIACFFVVWEGNFFNLLDSIRINVNSFHGYYKPKEFSFW